MCFFLLLTVLKGFILAVSTVSLDFSNLILPRMDSNGTPLKSAALRARVQARAVLKIFFFTRNINELIKALIVSAHIF